MNIPEPPSKEIHKPKRKRKKHIVEKVEWTCNGFRGFKPYIK